MEYSEEELLEAADVVNGETKPEEMGKMEWIWLALQGDFNPDRTPGQIGFDMVVSLIPAVDTVCDVRDLIANLVSYKNNPCKLTLFFIALTAIGFIPGVGSVVKGVVKIIFAYIRRYIQHVDDITNIGKLARIIDRGLDDALPKIAEFLQHNRVLKWATNNKVVNLFQYVAKDLRKLAKELSPAKLKQALSIGMDIIVATFSWIYRFLPPNPREYVENALDVIKKYQKPISDGIDQFIKPLQLILERTALRLEIHARNVNLSTVNRQWIGPITEANTIKLLRREGKMPKWAMLRTDPMPHPPHTEKDVEALTKAMADYQQYMAEYRKYMDDLGEYFQQEAISNPPYAELLRVKPPKMSAPMPQLPAKPAGVPKEWFNYNDLPAIDKYSIPSFQRGLMRPIHYPAGTRLYRVIDNSSDGAGQYWVTEEVFMQLRTRDEWRERLAVKPDWNQNGHYVTYTVPEGGLNAFVGPAASQVYDGTEYGLRGGTEQVFFNPGVRDTVERLSIHGQVDEVLVKTKLRKKINDPNIDGPFETGWGFNGDFGFIKPPAGKVHIALPYDDIQ
jgi:hypothetical protein